MNTREILAGKAGEAIAIQTTPSDILTSAIYKTFLTKEEIILAHTNMCWLLLTWNREDIQDPSDIFLKGSVLCK